jgi:hypothetical protein
MEDRIHWGEPGPGFSQRCTETRQLLASGFQEMGQFFQDRGADLVKVYLDR